MKIETISVSSVIFHDSDFCGKPKDCNALVSLYGQVYCGTPNFIEDYFEGTIEIPKHMIGQGDFFALRAKGDSMIDAGIYDGDILIIKMQDYAENGQIVVALIEQDVTLKRFFALDTEQKYLLHPENKEYNDIITSKCKIIGIAVKILKNI